MDSELNQNILNKIKEELANHLGLSPDDIETTDAFLEELHMQPMEFSDFIEELKEKGFETSKLELSSIKTVGDLVEVLSSSEYFE